MFTSESAVLANKTLADAGIDVWFARHAQAGHNLTPDKLDGNQDYPLTLPRGRFEAAQVDAFLATQGLDLILCADRQRTLQTYEAGSGFLAGIPFVVDARLNEQNYGELGGKKKSVLFKIAANGDSEDEGYGLQIHPTAETGQQVYQRAVSAIIEHAAALPAPPNRNRRVGVITHSAVIKNIVGIECGIPRLKMFEPHAYPIENGEVWVLKPGDLQPRRVFMPTHANPATMGRFSQKQVTYAQ